MKAGQSQSATCVRRLSQEIIEAGTTRIQPQFATEKGVGGVDGIPVGGKKFQERIELEDHRRRVSKDEIMVHFIDIYLSAQSTHYVNLGTYILRTNEVIDSDQHLPSQISIKVRDGA